MYKIIYFDGLETYNYFNVNDRDGINETIAFLLESGKSIICVIDFDSNIIIQRILDLKAHFDNIEDFIFDFEFLNG
jgi:hypothetical protein